MSNYQCSICNRNFLKKCHLTDHLNRKKKCQLVVNNSQNPALSTHPTSPSTQPASPSTQPTSSNNQLTSINNPLIQCNSNALPPIQKTDNINIPLSITTNNVTDTKQKIEYKCNYCQQTFTRKYGLYKHITKSCKIAMAQNKVKQEIYDKLVLLESKNKQLEEEIINKDKQLENKDKQIETKDKQLEEEIKKIKEEIKTTQSTSVMNNSNNIINSNNNIVNVINIVPHGEEDLMKNKVDDLLLILSTKKGYNAVLELISRVHFNSRFPEFQNVYIPDIKNNTAMVFDQVWELKNTEEVINNLYDSKSDYITDNKDIFYKHLNIGEQAVYARWAASNNNRNTEEYKEYITDMHKKIKLLMYNKKDMVIATKKLQAIKND
jgi:hypothetical protein